MTPQLLLLWRSLAKKGKLVLPMPHDGVDLLAPIEILPDAALPPEDPPTRGVIKIEAGGAIIRVPFDTAAARFAELALALQAQ